jgi:hypothetical protein
VSSFVVYSRYVSVDRRRKPQGKFLKMHPFWVPPELFERLKQTQVSAMKRVQFKVSRSELLRTIIALGLDEYDRRFAKNAQHAE